MYPFALFLEKFCDRTIGICRFEQLDFIRAILKKRRFHAFAGHFFFFISGRAKQFFKERVRLLQIVYGNADVFYFSHAFGCRVQGTRYRGKTKLAILILNFCRKTLNLAACTLNLFPYLCPMETNRQKKIGGVIQKDLVDILQGEVRKNGISNLVISVSKVVVTSDLSIATVHLSIFPQEKAAETLAAIKTNTPLIKHDLAQRVKLQLRKVPNLVFFIDDSLDYIEKIDKALAGKENPIVNRELLEKRRKS